MLEIRPFYAGVERDLYNVFHSAVSQVCCCDYSPEQISAWLPERYDHGLWSQKMVQLRPFIAAFIHGERDVIVGYADVQHDGYVDHFFVHGDYQSRGVGKALMNRLLSEKLSVRRLYAHVSISAKPFFEANGFDVLRPNAVTMRGVELTNFIMERKF